MLRLTTIHQSKGLEFPIVFLLGVADGLLPLTRAIDDGDVGPSWRSVPSTDICVGVRSECRSCRSLRLSRATASARFWESVGMSLA